MSNKTILLIALLLAGCANEPKAERAELPLLPIPEKPAFDCTEIKWYYISEKLAIDVADFKLLLKCEAANKAHTKNLYNQILYYRKGR